VQERPMAATRSSQSGGRAFLVTDDTDDTDRANAFALSG
jgi:hypothetical protein